jgi:hypothetical protein
VSYNLLHLNSLTLLYTIAKESRCVPLSGPRMAMSGYISTYFFEPVVRQARRFSNAPPGSPVGSPAVGDDCCQHDPDINPQGRAPSHVTTAHCVLHQTHFGGNIPGPTSSVMNLASKSTSHKDSPTCTCGNAQAQTLASVYGISSLGQAFFDRLPFVPRLRGRQTEDNTCPERTEGVVEEADQIATPRSADPSFETTAEIPITTTGQPTVSNAESTTSTSLPMHTSSPLRSGYRPFRRSTADARSITRDLEALERAARSLGRATRLPAAPQKIPEDDGLANLRQRIQAIWALELSTEEKARQMHDIMNESYYSLQPQARPRSQDSAIDVQEPEFETESRLKARHVPGCEHPTFDPTNPFNLQPEDFVPCLRPFTETPSPVDKFSPNNFDDDETESGPDLGCVHYKRNVKIQCFDCKTWWPCRLCHDEANIGHQLPRFNTQYMLCMLCSKPSEASQYCEHCQVRSSYYYCDICKLWEDDSTKRIYHCADCGICRIGEGIGKDYYHCKVCVLLDI